MNAITPNPAAKRTEKLQVAIVWAQLFAREANRELSGKSHTLDRATAQLRAALDALDTLEHDMNFCEQETSLGEGCSQTKCKCCCHKGEK